MNTSKLFTEMTLGAALLGASAVSQTAFAHNGKHQDVTVNIDSKGYHPAMLSVKAGKEVHLIFVSKEASCANAISIPALSKTLNLKPGQKKMLSFTPRKGQTIVFACNAKMFKGQVKAK